jgi:hypothetical protein
MDWLEKCKDVKVILVEGNRRAGMTTHHITKEFMKLLTSEEKQKKWKDAG